MRADRHAAAGAAKIRIMGTRNTKNAALARLPGRIAACAPPSHQGRTWPSGCGEERFPPFKPLELSPASIRRQLARRSIEQMVSTCGRLIAPRGIPRSLLCYDPSEANPGGTHDHTNIRPPRRAGRRAEAD